MRRGPAKISQEKNPGAVFIGVKFSARCDAVLLYSIVYNGLYRCVMQKQMTR